MYYKHVQTQWEFISVKFIFDVLTYKEIQIHISEPNYLAPEVQR